MFGRRKVQPEIPVMMPIGEQLQRSAKILVGSGYSYTDVALLWLAWNTVQNRHLETLDSLTR